MEGGTMSTSSTENLSSCVMQEDSASLIPCGAGYAAPPPTPSASCLPLHCFVPAHPPLQSKPTTSVDDDDLFLFPSASSSTTSPPSKQDLDALAQYLLQQSLHSTPNLLASPLIRQRKRRTPASIATVVPQNGGEDVRVANDVDAEKAVQTFRDAEKAVQTFRYARGFCEESKRGIGKACQEVGAFYVLVQDAEEALLTLKGRRGLDGESVVEGGLVTLSQLLITSTSPCHLHDDDLDINSSSFDSGVDTTSRDTITSFASLLSRVSKDVLRILLEDPSITTQSNIRDHILKPLLHIHSNGKQELNLEEDVVLSISHNMDIQTSKSSALFLARLGPRLQTWSRGKYKAAPMKTLYNDSLGELCIQFALVQHH